MNWSFDLSFFGVDIDWKMVIVSFWIMKSWNRNFDVNELDLVSNVDGYCWDRMRIFTTFIVRWSMLDDEQIMLWRVSCVKGFLGWLMRYKARSDEWIVDDRILALMSIVVGRNSKEFGIEVADNEFLMSTNKDFGYPRHSILDGLSGVEHWISMVQDFCLIGKVKDFELTGNELKKKRHSFEVGP